jgi:hypothetical protein
MAKIDITKTELVWPGKYNEDGSLGEVSRVSLPFQIIETVHESRATREAKKGQTMSLFDTYEGREGDTFEAGWRNKLIWGDNLLMRGCCPRPADRLKPPKGRDRVAETPLRQASREPLVGLAGRPLKAALRRLCAYLCGRAGHSSPPCARPAVRSAVARWSTARNCGWEAADEARYDARGRTKCLTHQPTRTSFRNQCRRASRS